jgi:hypothetical protein
MTGQLFFKGVSITPNQITGACYEKTQGSKGGISNRQISNFHTRLFQNSFALVS